MRVSLSTPYQLMHTKRNSNYRSDGAVTAEESPVALTPSLTVPCLQLESVIGTVQNVTGESHTHIHTDAH